MFFQYLGVWYEIERNNIVFEVATKCENATYSANDNGTVGVWNQAVTDYSGYYSIRGIAIVKNASEPGALQVIFSDPRKILFVFYRLLIIYFVMEQLEKVIIM